MTSTSSDVQPEDNSLTAKVERGEIDSIDTNARYLAYVGRIRTALSASSRYLAYTSDIGEAFRPIVHPAVVTAAYGVSWAYLGIDVSYEGYKAVKAGKDNATVATMVVKRGLFQSIASMALPMFTIHSIVKYSAKNMFNNVKHAKIKAWGPTSLGLSIVPFLPYLFDHPVETVVDKVFEPLEQSLFNRSLPKVAHQTVESEKSS